MTTQTHIDDKPLDILMKIDNGNTAFSKSVIKCESFKPLWNNGTCAVFLMVASWPSTYVKHMSH